MDGFMASGKFVYVGYSCVYRFMLAYMIDTFSLTGNLE